MYVRNTTPRNTVVNLCLVVVVLMFFCLPGSPGLLFRGKPLPKKTFRKRCKKIPEKNFKHETSQRKKTQKTKKNKFSTLLCTLLAPAWLLLGGAHTINTTSSICFQNGPLPTRHVIPKTSTRAPLGFRLRPWRSRPWSESKSPACADPFFRKKNDRQLLDCFLCGEGDFFLLADFCFVSWE